MPFLFRLALVALAGISLVVARHASQRSETHLAAPGQSAALGQLRPVISMASRQ